MTPASRNHGPFRVLGRFRVEGLGRFRVEGLGHMLHPSSCPRLGPYRVSPSSVVAALTAGPRFGGNVQLLQVEEMKLARLRHLFARKSSPGRGILGFLLGDLRLLFVCLIPAFLGSRLRHL